MPKTDGACSHDRDQQSWWFTTIFNTRWPHDTRTLPIVIGENRTSRFQEPAGQSYNFFLKKMPKTDGACSHDTDQQSWWFTTIFNTRWPHDTSRNMTQVNSCYYHHFGSTENDSVGWYCRLWKYHCSFCICCIFANFVCRTLQMGGS